MAEEEDTTSSASLSPNAKDERSERQSLLLIGELQGKKYKLSRLEEGTKVRGKDGKLHIERFVDGALVKEDLGKEPLPSFLSDASKGRSELFPKRYNRSSNRWFISSQGENEVVNFGVGAPSSASTSSESSAPSSSLSFVTFNVWFDDYYKEERGQALLDLVHKLDPDFICFQECTRGFLDIVKRQPWVCDGYALSDVEGSTIYPYGVLMLSKLPVHKFYLYKFPSSMGRRLLLAEVLYRVGDEEGLAPKKLAVSTAHLESLKEAQARIRQLEIVFRTLNAPVDSNGADEPSREYASSFHMGDFNFGDDTTSYPENDHLSKEFRDCWRQLYPNERGHTYKDDRFDKVIYRSDSFVLDTIEIIGNIPLFETEEEKEKVYPSDHYGLYSRFKLI